MLSPKRNLGYICQVDYKGSSSNKKEDGLLTDRAQAIRAAKDLGYGQECLRRLKKAETKTSIARIMSEYRRKML